jgi:KaiC/GvpD/RAD55 family RecA-like ATPase
MCGSSRKRKEFVKAGKKKLGKGKKITKKIPRLKKRVEEARERGWIKTGIPGFDELLERGMPRGKNILVAGGPGTGKTIFCLQTLYNTARMGGKSLYITFEEAPGSLTQHMRGFGWDFRMRGEGGATWNLVVHGTEKRGTFMITKQDPFRIARSVEALLAKATGYLRIKMEGIPELIPPFIKPDMIALDSISALESAFVGKPESYRIYIEQLFRLFEETGATTLLITETEEAPTRFSKTGVEEFLADGVFVLYNFKARDTRARAIEILKLRGTRHERKIVPFTIGGRGIEVFPNERIFEIG